MPALSPTPSFDDTVRGYHDLAKRPRKPWNPTGLSHGKYRPRSSVSWPMSVRTPARRPALTAPTSRPKPDSTPSPPRRRRSCASSAWARRAPKTPRLSSVRLPLLPPATGADARALPPDEIDKKTLEIRPVDDDVFSDVQSLADELPDHAPRFVLLSYPLTLVRCLVQ